MYRKTKKSWAGWGRDLLMVALVLMAASSASAQVDKGHIDNLDGSMPADVLDAMRHAGNIQSVFNVSSSEHYRGQVLRADQIVFSDGGSLILDSTDEPWILIVAKEIKFRNPKNYSKVSFATPALAKPGAGGSHGVNGTSATGHHGRNGLPGKNGTDGGEGSTGGSVHLPHLYIVAGEIRSPFDIPPFVNLAVLANGIDGGRGGKGGGGGSGGNGSSGLGGSDGVFSCNAGGGDGGNGGSAGRGGKGGAGGVGGNGGSVTMISSNSGAELLSYARLYNAGGFGGIGGLQGDPGMPGAGGGMGHGTHFCGGGSGGHAGSVPVPAALGAGSKGDDGKKGEFRVIVADDLDSILKI